MTGCLSVSTLPAIMAAQVQQVLPCEVCYEPISVIFCFFLIYSTAGIPTIIKPFFCDQFFWADRVEALGIGAAVRKLTVEHLTQALINATTDQRQIDRARTVGEQIRAVSVGLHTRQTNFLIHSLGRWCWNCHRGNLSRHGVRSVPHQGLSC